MVLKVLGLFLLFTCCSLIDAILDDYCGINLDGQKASELCVHGKCAGSKNGIECLCDVGFTGTYCDKMEFDFCSMPVFGGPAKNRCPWGTFCKNLQDGMECQCYSNIGPRCSDSGSKDSLILLTGGTTPPAEVSNPDEMRYLNSTEFYSPSENVKIPFGVTLPQAISGHAAAMLSETKLAIAGGWMIVPDEKGRFPDQISLLSTDFFDFTSGEWSEGPNMTYVHNSGAWTVHQGRLTICTGYELVNYEAKEHGKCEQLKGNAWVDLPPLSRGKYGAAAVSANGMLCILGGTVPCEDTYVESGSGMNISVEYVRCSPLPETSVECYNSSTGRWGFIANMSTPRTGLAAAAYQREIVACGGVRCDHTEAYWNKNASCTVNTCEKYSFETGSWQPMASMVNPKALFQMVQFNDGLVALGGFNSTENHKASALIVERFDPVRNEWMEIEPLDEGRTNFAAVVL